MFGFKNKNVQNVDIDNEPDFPAYEPEIKPATEQLKEAMQSPSKLYDLFIFTIKQNQDLSKRVSELETQIGKMHECDMQYVKDRFEQMDSESANHPSMQKPSREEMEEQIKCYVDNKWLTKEQGETILNGAAKETSMPKCTNIYYNNESGVPIQITNGCHVCAEHGAKPEIKEITINFENGEYRTFTANISNYQEIIYLLKKQIEADK